MKISALRTSLFMRVPCLSEICKKQATPGVVRPVTLIVAYNDFSAQPVNSRPYKNEVSGVQILQHLLGLHLPEGVSQVGLEAQLGVEARLDPELAEGLQLFTVTAGYMEVIDIVSLLESRGIDEKTIFYGIETIITNKPIWKLYSIIKKVSPPFAEFYTLPPEKMHGVAMRVVM